MCYDDNARAPIPPGTHGQAYGEDLVLTAVDGNRFAAYLAQPEEPALAQVLIYPDVRGLHQFYKDLALRFAEIGITALAIDYFGRSAGLTERNDDFDFWPHVKQLKITTLLADVSAALTYLEEDEGSKRATMVVGFCMGGSFSLVTAMSDLDITGIICFYAGLTRSLTGGKTVLEEAEKVKRPVLGLFGGADQGIPVSDVESLDQKLDVAGVEHKIVVYSGAPHSFFDRRYAQYAEACADAWQQVLDFIKAHTPSA